MKFNLRIGDLEVRSCDKHLLSEGEHEKAEIVKWGVTQGEDYCCTLAYWDKGEEGFNLKFVGGRPFDTDPRLFMRLAKLGYDWLAMDGFEAEYQRGFLAGDSLRAELLGE